MNDDAVARVRDAARRQNTEATSITGDGEPRPAGGPGDDEDEREREPAEAAEAAHRDVSGD